MTGKIALGGGGNATDSYWLDQRFATWLGPHGRLLYLPLAMRGLRPFDSCYAWLRTTFAPFALGELTMWTDLTQHKGQELAAFDGVYIGGGNMFSLLAQFLESGFDQHLIQYVQAGGAVYGGSAGAVLLSQDLRTISHLDANESGLTETRCLNLAADSAVWVHYTAQDDALITAFCARLDYPVLAIAERSGVVIEQGTLHSVGFEPAYRFTEEEKQIIPFAQGAGQP